MTHKGSNKCLGDRGFLEKPQEISYDSDDVDYLGLFNAHMFMLSSQNYSLPHLAGQQERFLSEIFSWFMWKRKHGTVKQMKESFEKVSNLLDSRWQILKNDFQRTTCPCYISFSNLSFLCKDFVKIEWVCIGTLNIVQSCNT